jgi:hypothetical protein
MKRSVLPDWYSLIESPRDRTPLANSIASIGSLKPARAMASLPPLDLVSRQVEGLHDRRRLLDSQESVSRPQGRKEGVRPAERASLASVTSTTEGTYLPSPRCNGGARLARLRSPPSPGAAKRLALRLRPHYPSDPVLAGPLKSGQGAAPWGLVDFVAFGPSQF